MGRRRRKVVKFPRKRLPKFFLCPKCGKEAVRVTLFKAGQRVRVECGFCGLSDEFSFFATMAPVDAYCKFVDRYNISIGVGVAS